MFKSKQNKKNIAFTIAWNYAKYIDLKKKRLN